jgi:hypothetical protein
MGRSNYFYTFLSLVKCANDGCRRHVSVS